MQGAIKFRNEPKAMAEFVATEGIYNILVTDAIEALTADTTLMFQKLWLYPGKAVAAGVLTANGGNINLGKSATYLPDVLAPGDLPLKYELPTGQKMQLAKVRIKGTQGDGVFYSYT